MSVGARALLATASDEHPRHSEASIVVDEHGSLAIAWSRFSSVIGEPPATDGATPAAQEWAHSRDNNPAEIAMARSTDGGLTWGQSWTAISSDASINVMQPSLLIDGAELVMTFSERNSAVDAARVIVRSTDRGLSWSTPRRLIDEPGYLTAAHDRLTILDDGTWLQPAHEFTTRESEGTWIRTVVLASIDRGVTWARRATLETTVGTAGHLSGVWEASIAQRSDGTLMMAMRSAGGSVFLSESGDLAHSWTTPRASHLRAPSAPSLLRRIRDDLFVLLRNDSVEPDHLMLGARRPLVLQLSHDGGHSWGEAVVVESEAPLDFHYVSCAVDGDALILSYSITDPATRLWSLATRTITIETNATKTKEVSQCESLASSHPSSRR